MVERKSQRAVKQEKKRRLRELIVIVAAVFVSLVIFGILTLSSVGDYKANESEIAEYESRLEDESIRSDELDKEKEYIKSPDYYKKIARERLGLVFPKEKILKPSN